MADQNRIFVSHSHTDNDYCRQYVAGLRSRGYTVWYDEHNLGWGALRPTIDAELQQSQHFVAILSPAAVASDWVNREIDAAVDLHDDKSSVLRTVQFVVAVRCQVPPLLRQWKRTEGPGGAAVSITEAVAKTVSALGGADPTVEAPAPQRRPRPRLNANDRIIGFIIGGIVGGAIGFVGIGGVSGFANYGVVPAIWDVFIGVFNGFFIGFAIDVAIQFLNGKADKDLSLFVIIATVQVIAGTIGTVLSNPSSISQAASAASMYALVGFFIGGIIAIFIDETFTKPRRKGATGK